MVKKKESTIRRDEGRTPSHSRVHNTWERDRIVPERAMHYKQTMIPLRQPLKDILR